MAKDIEEKKNDAEDVEKLRAIFKDIVKKEKDGLAALGVDATDKQIKTNIKELFKKFGDKS